MLQTDDDESVLPKSATVENIAAELPRTTGVVTQFLQGIQN